MRLFERARRGLAIVAGMAALSLAGAAPAGADAASDFYKGRTIVLLTGSAAGGGYDLSIRIFGEFVKPHLPEGTKLIVENKPGAAGRNAMNYLYNVAPRDGTYIIMPFNVDPIFQLLRPSGIRYDLRQMQWLGNLSELFNVLAFMRESNLKTIADAKKREVIVASSGRSSQTYLVPAMFNELLGTKFKIVTGYAGTRAMMLAMERGEAEGRAGSYEAWAAAKPDWLRDGKLVFLAQDGLARSKELPEVPLYEELVSDRDAKAIMRFLSYPVATSRALGLAPGVPADRLALLRKAYDATVKDPAFLREGEKRRLDLNPTGHERVEKVIAEVFATPPALVQRMQAILQFK